MSIKDRVNLSLRQKIFDGIISSEGRSTVIHSDSRGIPTLGAGTALAAGDPGKLVLLPLDKINQFLTDAGATRPDGSPLRFDQQDWTDLDNLVRLSNLADPSDRAQVTRDALADLKQTNTDLALDIGPSGRDSLLHAEMDRQFSAIGRAIVKVLDELPTGIRGNATLDSILDSLTSNQISALAQMGYNNPGLLIGPGLVGALARGDDWAAFNEIMTRSNKDLPGTANEPESGSDERGLQRRRLREAEEFSPFSGEGGVPKDAAEARSVLDRYTDQTIQNLIDYMQKRSLTPAEVTEHFQKMFPVDKLLATPGFGDDPAVRHRVYPGPDALPQGGGHA